MRRIIALLAIVIATGALAGCRDYNKLQQDCQNQHGYWDSSRDTCIFSVPGPTVTVTR